MNGTFFRQAALGLVLSATPLIFVFTSSAQYTDGMYAEFNTSMGSYTCRLEYASAPKAVANLIGLATGARAWLELASGQVKSIPYYDGTTFHRVIAGFVIQSGTRNGQTNPGYQFVDEFTPSQRHDAFGVLSMANSGPDSNGSQYFVTVAPRPDLDDVHTVFGRLFGGSNVVYAINQVATDSSARPLTNVVVQSVIIQRIGTAAQAFDINAQGLAIVTNLNLRISLPGGSVNVTFTNQINCNARPYLSMNLLNWSGINFGYETSVSQTGGLVPSGLLPRQFFRAAQVQYPPSLYPPRNVNGRTLTFNFSGGNGTIVVSFDGSGGGNYTWTLGSPGAVLYSWIQDPYRGRLVPVIFSGAVPPMELHLDCDSANAGTFKGTAYPNYPSTAGSGLVLGTFSSAP